jgi:transcriptional regulator
MYIPAHFKNSNLNEVKDFIKQNSFGILTSQSAGSILATHIPIELSEDKDKLVGHISRANPQWKNFNSPTEVLAIFSGPHAYISSSWYNHENVPTWNYIAVHVYGNIRIIEGDALFISLKNMVDKYEQTSANPIALEKMSPEYVKRAMQGIVGFEIDITKIEAAYKLSQNRDETSHGNVISELEKKQDNGSIQIAKKMKESKTKL